LKDRCILTIVAHPDDEVLGCGGTIARHVRQGARCYTLILAEGITSRDDNRDPELRHDEIRKLKLQAQNAGRILGVAGVSFGSFPDNRMDSVDFIDIVKTVEKAVEKYKPQGIYTHHFGDLNIDHQITAQAVETAVRPIAGQPVREIYAFETPSSTEWSFANVATQFCPNFFIDIEKTLETKIKALNNYSTEKRLFPHPRSADYLVHLAAIRGAQSGLKAAEAFHLIRKIV